MLSLLSDASITQFAETHQILLKSVAAAAYIALKVLAIMHPRAPTNRIIELFQNALTGGNKLPSKEDTNV